MLVSVTKAVRRHVAESYYHVYQPLLCLLSKMRSSLTCLYVVVAASLTFASANSAWSFEDASVSVQGKGAGIDGGSKKER